MTAATTAFPTDTPYALLCDIGGTHARLACTPVNAPHHLHHIEKYKTTDYKGLAALVADYLTAHDLPRRHLNRILIASAVRPNAQGIVQFDTSIKATDWRIAPAELAAHFGLSPDNITIMLDTQAQFHGLGADNIEVARIKSGATPAPEGQSLLISIGTGLGHAYRDNATSHITPTSGGHMMPVTVTQEQHDALQFIAAMLQRDRSALIYEDVVSGRGFFNLYRFACKQDGASAAHSDMHALAAAIENEKNSPQMAVTSRLFFEFLGLYIHMLALTTHSYQRCTLIGGLLRRLHELNLWDADALNHQIILPRVSGVAERLRALPVDLVMRPHLSLYGLLTRLEKGH